jgi:hypothetical protein
MPGDETWGMFEIALFLASAICIFTAATMAVACSYPSVTQRAPWIRFTCWPLPA